MFWAQALLCFAVWVGFGLLLFLRASQLRSWLMARSRNARMVIGVVGLIAGGFILTGGLYAVASYGGMQEGVLTPWAWLAVGVLGLPFVASQVVGAAALLLASMGGPRKE